MHPTDPISAAFSALQAGDIPSARSGFVKCLKSDPDNAVVWDGLGLALRSENDLQGALEAGLKATKYGPELAHVWSNLANTRAAMGDDRNALSDYRSAIQLNPDFAEAWASLGLAEARLGLKKDAIASLKEASRLFPRDANAQNTIGNQLFNFDEFETARVCYEKAVRLNQSFANAWNNLGNTYLQLLDLPRAIEAYERALEADPQHAEAANGYAQALLMSGDFKRGWTAYEKRVQPDTSKFEIPLWNGQCLQGKSLMLICEQGMGDTFQFIRFAKHPALKGASVFLDCPQEMTSLVRHVEGISIVPSRLPNTSIDYILPLMSLPYRLGLVHEKQFATDSPYIQLPNPDSPKNACKKVGLVWAGNPNHINDTNRSLKFSDLASLLDVEGFEFHSFQQAGTASHSSPYEPSPQLLNQDRSFSSWEDSACKLQKMDLLISVDTAMAHLAGAMGIPCWVLLPYVPDWRWMLRRSDSPWHPSLKLFRQPFRKDWKAVIAAVKQALEQVR